MLAPFFLLDVETVPEHSAADGRSGVVICAPELVWVVGLVVDGSAAEGLRQIAARRCWQDLEHQRPRLVLLSVSYSRAARQIDSYEFRLVVSGDPNTCPPEGPGQARPPPGEAECA